MLARPQQEIENTSIGIVGRIQRFPSNVKRKLSSVCLATRILRGMMILLA